MGLALREPLDVFQGSNAHPNPMFNFLTGFMPRKLKDMFRWTEYLYFNSPHIFQALQKLADYVITDITFTTESDALRKQYTSLVLKRMRGKALLKAASRDRAIYGNGFFSVYFPFKRILPCTSCRSLWDIRAIKSYKYNAKKGTVSYTCRACNDKSTVALEDMRDIKIYDPKRINVIRWDPKQMELKHNPITGQTEYYYSIPADLRSQIEDGDPNIINTTPKGFLRAAKDDETSFKFDPEKIFHMKMDAPAGVDSAWGFPSVMAVMKQFFYAEVLRKANEAIALDHLVPFRVLHPAQTSGSNDPAQTISFAQWIDETKKNIKFWRRDPLHIMFAPVALGVTQMGGQGRTLLTLGEVKEAEDNIIAGLGVPREFLYGGLSYTGSSITLRMLENQLIAHTADLKDLLQWITDSVADYMGWETVEAEITNFKFIDDVQQKQMMMQADATYNLLSRRTVAEVLDVDYDEEQEQMKQEMLDQIRDDAEMQREAQKIQESLAERAQAQAMQGTGMAYDQQAVIAEAEAIVQELANMPEGQRRSYLSSLQAEDYVMYSVVIQRWEEFQLQMTNQAEQQIQM